MGLHRKVRYVINLDGRNRTEQKQSLVSIAQNLHDAVSEYIYPKGTKSEGISWKFARFLGMIFTFVGFEDNEIYTILSKEADKERK